jgi:hypothetical protein
MRKRSLLASARSLYVNAGEQFDRFFGNVQDGNASYNGHSTARQFHISHSKPEASARFDPHRAQSAALVQSNIRDGTDLGTIRRIDRGAYQAGSIRLFCDGFIRKRHGDGQP